MHIMQEKILVNDIDVQWWVQQRERSGERPFTASLFYTFRI